jgi:hypothetical protein
MERGSSECSQVLEQIEASLRAIRLHLITYQLQLLRLSLRNPAKITDAGNYRTEPRCAEKTNIIDSRTRGSLTPISPVLDLEPAHSLAGNDRLGVPVAKTRFVE